ncbi:MAG TPA: glycosyltransferase, partial [Candidatus Sulfotelmatobacter sp.]|nr:glycosyltransferase [Candidatus Sulfotelmatobacter sp.]
MKISVVIPALNERIALPVLISSLRAFESIQEIIVADGGSTDGTQEWCIRKPGILLVHSDTGKGRQINAGAAQATGDLLLFLHADSCLSSSAFRAMEDLIASQDFAGGAFHVCFAGKRTAGLRMVEKGINLRTSIRHTATGDQGIFV